MAVSGDEQVLARIGFAQRWLDRAKHQCTEGNLPRGVLTLVLADAEVHHAMEAAGAPVRAGGRRMRPAALLLGGTALIVALSLAVRWPGQSGTTSSLAPSLVQLSSSSGTLLKATGASAVHSGSVPVATVPGGASAPRHGAIHRPVPMATPLPETPRSTVQPLASSAPPVSTTSSHITMSELIDLVLTAERALRQQPVASLSP